jgi:hypothetical protein
VPIPYDSDDFSLVTRFELVGRPKDVNEFHAVKALVEVEVQTLAGVWLFLLGVVGESKVALFIAKGTGETPHFHLGSRITSTFA